MEKEIQKLIKKYEANIKELDKSIHLGGYEVSYEKGTVETLNEVVDDLKALLKG